MSNAKQDQGPEKVCACGAHFRSAYVEICGACLTRNARRFWLAMGSYYTTTDAEGNVTKHGLIPGETPPAPGQPKRKRRHGKAKTHGGGTA